MYHRNRLRALLDATCAKIQALFQSSVPDESVPAEPMSATIRNNPLNTL
ncbi:MAG: hypothetical protein ACYCZJ_02270 [Sulfuriferula sp.]